MSFSKSSMKRKSLLHVLGKASSSRQSAIPVSPNPSVPPSSANSSTYPRSTSDDSFGHTPDLAPSNTLQYVSYPGSALPSAGPSTSGSGSYAPGPGALGAPASESLPSATGASWSLMGGRSVSTSAGSTREGIAAASEAGPLKDRERKSATGPGAQGIRRPEDVFKVVKERLLAWSYLVQWYQGDTHWLNTVKVSQHAFESSLGLVKLEARARSFYALGTSLAGLFDIPSAPEYLRALSRLLDEWEAHAEGRDPKGGVKNLFRAGGQKGKRPSAGGLSDFPSPVLGAGTGGDNESYLVILNLPFPPDFFQVHSSTCAIIRDVYKKILGLFLPAPPRPGRPPTLSSALGTDNLTGLVHPSTFIHSAPLESPFPPQSATFDPRSPTSVSSHGMHPSLSDSSDPDRSNGARRTTLSPTLLSHSVGPSASGSASFVQRDALQSYLAGELPPERTLVGEGQKLSPQVVDLFQKVDLKLKKHFGILIREGDDLARRVLEDELAALTASLTGGEPLRFDLGAAVSGAAGAYELDESYEYVREPGVSGTGSATGISFGLEEDDSRENVMKAA